MRNQRLRRGLHRVMDDLPSLPRPDRGGNQHQIGDMAVPGHPRADLGGVGLAAVVEAAMDAYVVADPPVPITSMLRRGLADVAAGLPEGGQHE